MTGEQAKTQHGRNHPFFPSSLIRVLSGNATWPNVYTDLAGFGYDTCNYYHAFPSHLIHKMFNRLLIALGFFYPTSEHCLCSRMRLCEHLSTAFMKTRCSALPHRREPYRRGKSLNRLINWVMQITKLKWRERWLSDWGQNMRKEWLYGATVSPGCQLRTGRCHFPE